jgi:predicted transposase/invertase (TIGR01784 family)
MRTDTLFYQVFQTFNTLLFELIGLPPSTADGYEFASVEVKEKAFRFDGIFLPPKDDPNKFIWFVEVQFQNKPEFYLDFISEIFLYLSQYKPPQNWRAVAVFAKRSLVPSQIDHFHELLHSDRILNVYLDELAAQVDDSSIALMVVKLIVAKEKEAIAIAKQLAENFSDRRSNFESSVDQDKMIELVEAILVYKLPQISREEIQAMFTREDLIKTRFYKDAFSDGEQVGLQQGEQFGLQRGEQRGEQRGLQQGKTALILRMLTKKFGSVTKTQQQQIQKLAIAKLDDLADQIFDFENLEAVTVWLNSQRKKRSRQP